MKVAVLVSREERLGLEERIAISDPYEQLFDVRGTDFKPPKDELGMLAARALVECQPRAEHAS